MKKSLLVILLCYFPFAIYSQTPIGSEIWGEDFYNGSGSSISMPDESTIAIGAPGNNSSDGHVRIYSWNGISWIQKGADIDPNLSGARSGHSVSMPDPNTVAIGSPANILGGMHDGYASVYRWNGSAWIQKGSTINGNNQDELGTSVSMPDSNTLAVGAPGYGVSAAGLVKIYTWDGNDWLQKGTDINGDNANDRYGCAVSMPKDSIIAIGGYGNDTNGPVSGHVRVFQWNGSSWLQKGSTINGESIGDWSGFSVSMADGDHVAVGSIERYSTPPNPGNVRIFEYTTNWTQKGTTLEGVNDDDFFGYAISMPNENTIAVGAPNNSGMVGYDSSGQVQKFKWNGAAWVQAGNDMEGYYYEQLGYAVCMPSPDFVAVGAPASQTGKGYVLVFAIDSIANIDNNKIDSLEVFPNPSNGEFYFSCYNESDLHVELVNSNGEILRVKTPIESGYLNLKHLNPGTYLLRIYRANERIGDQKIVVY